MNVLVMNPGGNSLKVDVKSILSTPASARQALVIVTEEGLQIAHECKQALSDHSG
jgi:acetate kinase